jgi:hypothetical protein
MLHGSIGWVVIVVGVALAYIGLLFASRATATACGSSGATAARGC